MAVGRASTRQPANRRRAEGLRPRPCGRLRGCPRAFVVGMLPRRAWLRAPACRFALGPGHARAGRRTFPSVRAGRRSRVSDSLPTEPQRALAEAWWRDSPSGSYAESPCALVVPVGTLSRCARLRAPARRFALSSGHARAGRQVVPLRYVQGGVGALATASRRNPNGLYCKRSKMLDAVCGTSYDGGSHLFAK